MEHKLTHGQYETIAAFVEDARLVFSNCLLYNPEGSVYAKNATKMEKSLNDQLALHAPHAADTMP
jgi:histone acetyltransferase